MKTETKRNTSPFLARVATIKRPFATREEISILTAYRSIPSKKERRALVVLAEGIAFGPLTK